MGTDPAADVLTTGTDPVVKNPVLPMGTVPVAKKFGASRGDCPRG